MNKNGVLKQRVFEQVHLLAHPSEQLEYERKVPNVHVPSELVSGFCDDLYSPIELARSEEFTDDELKQLAHLYGLLSEAAKIRVNSVTELLKTREWRSVLTLSKEMLEH